MNQESPVNPIPPVIMALCLIAVAVELYATAMSTSVFGGQRGGAWRLSVVENYAFSPAVLDAVLSRGDYDFAILRRFVTYPFVHASFTQALFGSALLLALGKFVGDIFNPLATLAVFVTTSVSGAIVFGLVAGGTAPLLGLFPPVYGLIGAFTYVIWLRLGQTGQNQLAAFRLIGFLLALQLVFGLIFGSNLTWVAELSAFLVGFAISTVLAPGGWAALVHRMRQRP